MSVIDLSVSGRMVSMSCSLPGETDTGGPVPRLEANP